MPEITLDSVVNFLRSVADDPDLSAKVNPRDDLNGSCLYHDGHGNYCLVGYWFVSQIGVDEDCLELIEGDSASVAIDKAITFGWLASIDDRAVNLLEAAQSKADFRSHYAENFPLVNTWGNAINAINFDEYV